jgi:steroid delta-isomerase-like uncharacterized protein
MPSLQSTESTRIKNKILRVFYDEILNQGKLDLVDDLFTPDFVSHPGELDVAIPGREPFKGVITRLKTSFPDLHFIIEDTVSEDNRLVVRWIMEGTHLSDLDGIAATGKRIRGYGITIFRLEENRISELWAQTDRLGFVQQLVAQDPDVSLPIDPVS